MLSLQGIWGELHKLFIKRFFPRMNEEMILEEPKKGVYKNVK
jgi:hypothetical protein